MPKGKKDHRFNHEKFEHRAVRAEQVSGGKVEEEKSVQGQADGDIVDDGHVEIPAGHTVTKQGEPGHQTKSFLVQMLVITGMIIYEN